MDTDPRIEAGREAADRVEQRASQVVAAGEEGQRRWRWVGWAVVVMMVALAVIIVFVLRANSSSQAAETAAKDAKKAAEQAAFSEDQRQRRTLQSECRTGYQIEGDLARDVADQAQVKFNKAILSYLAFGRGSLADAVILQQEQDRALFLVEVAKSNLTDVKEGRLCSAKEFGVVIPNKGK